MGHSQGASPGRGAARAAGEARNNPCESHAALHGRPPRVDCFLLTATARAVYRPGDTVSPRRSRFRNWSNVRSRGAGRRSERSSGCGHSHRGSSGAGARRLHMCWLDEYTQLSPTRCRPADTTARKSDGMRWALTQSLREPVRAGHLGRAPSWNSEALRWVVAGRRRPDRSRACRRA